ncbi:MAG: PQQ-binding-like beta-propeller repeat protein [Planctomycetes bacterium]|nr:PQQ-binding-like beta-propeller repeat protein [Planctomycetota bacterium]
METGRHISGVDYFIAIRDRTDYFGEGEDRRNPEPAFADPELAPRLPRPIKPMHLKKLPRAGLPLLVLVGGLLLFKSNRAADWPMSRFDAQRSAASPQKLAENLHLQWVREFPPVTPAWLDQAKMQFDSAYDPILVGKTLFLASSRHDWLMALDVETGNEKWRFFAEGPIRFAPVGWENKLYFTSDDGYLYCVAADRGTLLWKFRGGPSDRKILGNERLISTWPARGAPVVKNGTVYFAASIWPFMGTFIHALDARTGKVVWTNDGDGSIYMKQPHNADAFAGVAPQGPLVAIGDRLLVPGGRSVPACFDRQTGKMLRYQLAENGKRGGGSEVSASDKYFFNGGSIFDLETEHYLADIGNYVVVALPHVFAFKDGSCRAFDLASGLEEIVDSVDRKGKETKLTRWQMDEIASCKLPGVESLIKSGPRLYAGGREFVQAIDLDLTNKAMKPGWHGEVEGTVVRLLSGADRLFAVTREGRVYCFGADRVEPKIIARTRPTSETPEDGWAEKAERILKATHIRDGYCIAWGIGSGRLIQELMRQSTLHIFVLDPDETKVLDFRNKKVARDWTRVEAFHGDPVSFAFPPYVASLMVCEELGTRGMSMPDLLKRHYPALRPYGGTACFFNGANDDAVNLVKELSLEHAQVRGEDKLVRVTREGALPGAANWTHEHADASNTRVSRDHLVKAPLGILWFGGPSHEGILPRHGHGPQPQVIDGRMIIEGVDMLRAIDIYTGRLLWETRLPGVGAFYNNLAHQPGANSAGSNYVCSPDCVFVALDRRCVRLDVATGRIIAEFALPPLGDADKAPRWGYINVLGDYLIGGAEPIFNPRLLPPEPKLGNGDDKDPGTEAKEDPLGKLLKSLRGNNDNFSSSKQLVVMDRHSGKVLWSATARSGFRHNATCMGGGRLYTIDRLSGEQVSQFERRGEEPPHTPRLLAFDLKTGKELWSTDADVFGTWLSYSEKHDVLVEAGRVARDTLYDEPKGMRAYGARDGAVLWFEKDYIGPAMIHGDTILQDQGGCDLLTGALKMRSDPLTGQLAPWKWTRNYGCNTPAASEHLLTFRSGAAGYFDLCNDGGTGNFGGFRSSCTNNLIVAGGVLTAPDYTRTCTCLYQNQASVGLIHMPEAEEWTFFGSKEIKGTITRLGINFGAPGDRKADHSTLWLEYPSVAGPSPAVEVVTKPSNLETYRRHSSAVPDKHGWITSSGVKGLSELRVKLTKGEKRTYTVRLYFAEPEDVAERERVFHLKLQGRSVCENLDILKESGGRFRTLIKEFKGIEVAGDLTLQLIGSGTVANRPTILCGLEVVAEDNR